jgi:hypothetical protein
MEKLAKEFIILCCIFNVFTLQQSMNIKEILLFSHTSKATKTDNNKTMSTTTSTSTRPKRRPRLNIFFNNFLLSIFLVINVFPHPHTLIIVENTSFLHNSHRFFFYIFTTPSREIFPIKRDFKDKRKTFLFSRSLSTRQTYPRVLQCSFFCYGLSRLILEIFMERKLTFIKSF